MVYHKRLYRWVATMYAVENVSVIAFNELLAKR